MELWYCGGCGRVRRSYLGLITAGCEGHPRKLWGGEGEISDDKMSELGQYLQGYDVGGWPGHLSERAAVRFAMTGKEH